MSNVDESVSILEYAQRLRDEIIADANKEAEGIRAGAHDEVDRVVSEARVDAARLLEDAEKSARMMTEGAEAAKDKVLSGLAAEELKLREDIENLRRFESDYRSRLINLVEFNLRALFVSNGDGEQGAVDWLNRYLSESTVGEPTGESEFAIPGDTVGDEPVTEHNDPEHDEHGEHGEHEHGEHGEHGEQVVEEHHE